MKKEPQVDTPELSTKAKDSLRRQQRGEVWSKLHSTYCKGKWMMPGPDLLAQAAEADPFANMAPMNAVAAIRVIQDCATHLAWQQKGNKFLFQAWFVLGHKSFWNIMENFMDEELLFLEMSRRRCCFECTSSECFKGNLMRGGRRVRISEYPCCPRLVN